MKLLSAVLLMHSSSSGYGQVYAFNNYGLDEGLPQTTVEHIMQDSRGYLWVATHGGAARFDGHHFREFTTSQGLANNNVHDLYEDKYGNIWFGTDGGVSVYTAAEIEPKFFHFDKDNGFNSSRAYAFLERDDKMLIGSNKGMFSFSYRNFDSNPFADTLKLTVSEVYQTINKRAVFCLFKDSKDQLWAGTDSGIVVMRNGAKYYTTSNGMPTNEIICIAEDLDKNLWVGTKGGVAKFAYSSNGDLVSVKNKIEVGLVQLPSRVTDICFLEDGTMLLSYPNLGVFKPHKSDSLGYKLVEHISIDNGINSSGIQKIFKDREGNLWFGGSSNGISMLVGRKFETYTTSFGLSANPVRAIVKDDSSNFWFGTASFVSKMKSPVKSNKIHRYGDQFIESYGPEQGMKTTSIWSLLTDDNNNVWIGGSKGLFKYDGKRYEHFSSRSGFKGSATMRSYQDREGVLWFSTFKGITCYNVEKDSLYSPFKEDDELYGKLLSYIYQDKNLEFWFGYSGGLVHRGINNYKKHYTMENGLPSNYVSLIIPDKNGNLWLGTGKGISCFDGETFKNFSTKDGLNSDTPYLLIFDDDENLWVGTNKGLDRLTIDFSTNSIKNINFYGADEGFIGVETNSNAAFKDDNGDLWFGTVGGVTRYQKKYDNQNDTEPVTLITRLRVQFKDQPMVKDLALSYSENHVMFDFIGISLKSPKKVKYKFRLKGLEEEWSPDFSERFTTYSNLPAGNYTFQVISCNNHGKWNKNPTEYYFKITPPFWRTWWFYSISTLTIGVIIFQYLKSRTARFKREKEVLETKVNERTKELNIQNEKLKSAKLEIEKNRDILEEKNRDITDSITYAQRIQLGMLPSDEVIKASFNDCFVLYRPKDIVSGDFYWLQKADDKTFFAAVDCTGHGVPGAMVSVLGYNALNRAIREFGMRTPASILDTLNDIVIDTFSQSEEDVRDGMDISLCCIYQENGKWKLEYAGANNPVWIYKCKSKEIEEIKANKQPIGVYDDGVPFTNNVIDVDEGDVIYLFSDGFSDQFGGEKGKKLKGRKFREIITEIGKQPMQQQLDRMNFEFDAWKADYEQVDDVCIIGIRI